MAGVVRTSERARTPMGSFGDLSFAGHLVDTEAELATQRQEALRTRFAIPSPCTCWQLPLAALVVLAPAQQLQLLLSFSTVASLDADVQHLLLPALRLQA